MTATKTASLNRRSPRVIECEEQGPVDIAIADVLDDAGRVVLNPEIEKGDYFAVTLRRGNLTLRARGYVGYIPLNDRIVVYVSPRVPIRNLTRMARISGEPPTVLSSIREYGVEGEWDDSLADLFAAALIHHVGEVSQGGLLREYERREAVSSFPHGRLLAHRTLQTLVPRGVHHAAHTTWYERTSDTPANRCLKYAIWMLARHYIESRPRHKASKRLHRQLNAIYSVFDGVELDHSRGFFSDPVVRGARPLPTLRGYYRDALNVAVAIIEQRAVLLEQVDGAVRLPSLVLNMNNVFEGYVRNVLSLHAKQERWALEVLDGNTAGRKLLFNKKPSEDATPDIVLRRPDGSTALVLELKNVPVADSSPREAINQAVTYAVSYQTNKVVLVHPLKADQAGGLKKLGTVDQIDVYQYRFDLNVEDMDVEDERFGLAVAALLPASDLPLRPA